MNEMFKEQVVEGKFLILEKFILDHSLVKILLSFGFTAQKLL